MSRNADLAWGALEVGAAGFPDDVYETDEQLDWLNEQYAHPADLSREERAWRDAAAREAAIAEMAFVAEQFDALERWHHEREAAGLPPFP